MKVGVLGTGDVGKVLATGFITLGHEVKMGSRTANNEKAVGWAKGNGPKASAGTFAEAAEFGEVVVLATLGAANAEALELAGRDRLRGKVLIDTTNPLDFSKGFPPSLSIAGTDSGGEQVQRLVPDAHVVKAFNIVGNANMFRPNLAGGPPDMLIAGDDEGAKKKVVGILNEFGWEAVTDLGGIACSRYLEAMCMVWVLYAARTGQWTHAFKVLRK
jgi:8-hydroxy-5-deazaflavin:NADPH oxidoreductase